MAGKGANNDYGVSLSTLDVDKIGKNATKTYHGAAIRIGSKMVGRITSFQAQAYSREGVHVYELNPSTWGHPVDYVPGKTSGFSITIARTELWNDELEHYVDDTFNPGNLMTTLMDQVRPFQIQEVLHKGNGTLGTSPAHYKTWTYKGCWFTEKNLNAQEAQGDGQISVNATIAYVSRSQS